MKLFIRHLPCCLFNRFYFTNYFGELLGPSYWPLLETFYIFVVVYVPSSFVSLSNLIHAAYIFVVVYVPSSFVSLSNLIHNVSELKF